MSSVPDFRANGGSLLMDLHRAHEDVLGGMEELGRLTRDSLPDDQALSSARWKLSQASMRRRLLWARILGHLAPVVDRDANDDLLRLQKLDIELLGASTDHIKKWTIDAIIADWPGYCLASRHMRWKMIARMEEEKRVLYPLLRGRHGQSHGSTPRLPETPRRAAFGR